MRAQDPGSAENGELEDVTQKYNTSCPGTETTAKVRLEKIVQSFSVISVACGNSVVLVNMDDSVVHFLGQNLVAMRYFVPVWWG